MSSTLVMRPRDLIAAAEQEQVAQNMARARQLVAARELAVACAEDPVDMDPDSESCLEIGGVLGVHPLTVHGWLDVHHKLTTWFPGLWALCSSGRLDLWKARIFVDAAETIEDEAEIALFAADVDAYFARCDDPTTAVVRLTRQQLQRAAKWRVMKRVRKTRIRNFTEAHAQRRVWLSPDEHGMGALGVRAPIHDLISVDYRMTLIAKRRCQDDPEGRTLEQMRADTVVDLLMGRLTVGALTSELEDEETSTEEDVATTFRTSDVGAFARPVINLTMSLTTMLGLNDDPGLLSGDHPIPADLARWIATQPGSTWHRLLTDEAGRFIELSTTSYQPTAPMWRADVARDRTCVWPGCCRPSVVCEIDHRIPWPQGPTSTENTWPLCGRHHKAKHTEGYTVEIEPDGTYLFRTRHGTELRRRPGEAA